MYFSLSLNKAGQPNWTAPAYVAGVILLSARFLPPALRPGGIRKLAVAGVTIAVVTTFLLHGFTRWFHLPPKRDVLDRARGSADLAAKVDAAKARTNATYVIANKYSTASLMKFYMAGHPRVYQPDTTPRIAQPVLHLARLRDGTAGVERGVRDGFRLHPRAAEARFRKRRIAGGCRRGRRRDASWAIIIFIWRADGRIETLRDVSEPSQRHSSSGSIFRAPIRMWPPCASSACAPMPPWSWRGSRFCSGRSSRCRDGMIRISI